MNETTECRITGLIPTILRRKGEQTAALTFKKRRLLIGRVGSKDYVPPENTRASAGESILCQVSYQESTVILEIFVSDQLRIDAISYARKVGKLAAERSDTIATCMSLIAMMSLFSWLSN